VDNYFKNLSYLDLSPYYGYTSDEKTMKQTIFSHKSNKPLTFYETFQKLCPQRRSLSLAYSSNLTCSGLKYFLDNPKNGSAPTNWSEPLVGLNLYYCTKLKRKDGSDTLVDLIIDNAPELLDLNLSEIRNLTFHVLYRLATETRIKRLCVSGSFRRRKTKKISDSPPRPKGDDEYLSKLESVLVSGETCLKILDIQDCTLLRGLKFFSLSEQDKKDIKLCGMYRRGQTWIIGPNKINWQRIGQCKCINCDENNPKFARSCFSCKKSIRHSYSHKLLLEFD